MENTFSTNASETIQKEIKILENETNSELIKKNLKFYFDIDQSVEWILKNKFRRIALQFPDELLQYSTDVCKNLQKQCFELENDAERYLFILGDTSYGSCCVDIVASEHYNADSLIHYGHSCLSLIEKLPVLYVFEKFELDLDLLKTELGEISLKIDNNELGEKYILVIYDVSYHHLFESLKDFEKNNTKVIVSEIIMNNDSKIDGYLSLFSRRLPSNLELEEERLNYLFFYIGNKEPFLNSFQLYFNKNKFFNFTSLNGKTSELITFKDTNRKLMKRFYLIEKAKDSQIFGILIGTMAISKYKEAINHASSILRKVNRKYYSFLIGKLNCAKLNNFMEVDMYVLIACNENSILDSKEFNKPVITLYELEIAFNSARLWGEQFISDYSLLLNGMKHYVPLELSKNESDVSLISGEMRHMRTNGDSKDNNNSLIKRDDALSIIHHAGAGEFLKNRSWVGLEQNLGKTPIVPVVEGKMGIAMGYANEKDGNE